MAIIEDPGNPNQFMLPMADALIVDDLRVFKSVDHRAKVVYGMYVAGRVNRTDDRAEAVLVLTPTWLANTIGALMATASNDPECVRLVDAAVEAELRRREQQG